MRQWKGIKIHFLYMLQWDKNKKIIKKCELWALTVI